MRGAARIVPPLLLSLILLCVAPTGAGAVLTIEPGATPLELVNKAGEPETRAGAHPDRLIQGLEFTDLGGTREFPKELTVDLPSGLTGNANAVPFCPRNAINTAIGQCPPESQIGTMTLDENGTKKPIYNVRPSASEVVTLVLLNQVPTYFSGRLRPGDLGLSLTTKDMPNKPITFLEFPQGPIELWGIPADHQTETSIPRRPLLTLPTRCDLPPLASTTSVRTWQQPERWLTGIGDTGRQIVGCGDLGFDPSLAFRFDDQRADTPSGATIEVSIPQNDDPDGRATSQVRNLSFAMPAGTMASPGGASGLEACADAQFGLGTAAAPTCPASSQVGTIELSVSALTEPIGGRIYFGEGRPGDRFRFLVAADAKGTPLKFTGSVAPDPVTGQLTVSLTNLPQAPFDRMSLHLDGGADALLATPLSCGSVPVTGKFTPQSGGPTVDLSTPVTVNTSTGAPCAGPPPFSPTVTGGSTNSGAGRSTSLTVTVRRQDGEQLPDQLRIALPAGMSAALGKVSPCSSAQVAAAACPTSSRIGGAVVVLGPGTIPVRTAGDVFLTGPYRGAPFGIALVLKGAFGAFDLGTSVLRGALQVDRLSNQVVFQMDSLPTTLGGMPIRFQTIGLDLDHPDFMRNPTSCAPTRMAATMRSATGATSTSSIPFAIRGCVDLPFRPAVSMALTDRGELRAEGRPGMSIAMKVPAGSANLRSARIRFPQILKLAPTGLREVCARKQALRGNCPKGSRVGSANARTPLLDEQMKGSLYIVQPRGGGSPDLWASIEGQGLKVDLRGETAIKDGKAETSFVGIPDFPLTSLRMHLASGKSGLLQLRSKPCGRLVGPTKMGAQNGALVEMRARLTVPARCVARD